MVYNYISLNSATLKTNYPLRRPEPIINDMVKKKARVKFQTDGINGYWVVGTYRPYQYKAAFSTILGQYIYTRMGQGLTGALGTYLRTEGHSLWLYPPALRRASPLYVYARSRFWPLYG